MHEHIARPNRGTTTNKPERKPIATHRMNEWCEHQDELGNHQSHSHAEYVRHNIQQQQQRIGVRNHQLSWGQCLLFARTLCAGGQHNRTNRLWCFPDDHTGMMESQKYCRIGYPLLLWFPASARTHSHTHTMRINNLPRPTYFPQKAPNPSTD